MTDLDEYADLFAPLAGEVTMGMSDSWAPSNLVVVWVKHRLLTRCWGVQQALVRHALDDGPVMRMVMEHLARKLQPWLDPDPNPMPTLVLFPRLERLEHELRELRTDWLLWRWRLTERRHR